VSATRVLVADALRIVRTGVRTLLEREGDFEVLEAASIDELVATAEREAPDIILVAADLPPDGGVEAVRLLAAGRGQSCIVAWGFRPSAEEALAALRAGAHGFLAKEISAAGLVRAMRAATRGQAPLARDLVSALISELHGAAVRANALERTAVLSAREREVLDLVARGARNREIAAALRISEFTVKRHIQNILEKLELRSRRDAAGLYRAALRPEEVPVAAG
jgi:two-component system, NarL family, nitrate/nitrite response regulator NarL